LKTKQFDKVRFAVAGKGDSSELEKLAMEQNMNDFVEFLGGVSEEDKIALLDRAWVYVTASSREGWGLTVTEANACGTPAIAYNVPGLRDSVVNGTTGLLVEGWNVKALADSIIRVLQDDVCGAGYGRCNEVRRRIQLGQNSGGIH